MAPQEPVSCLLSMGNGCWLWPEFRFGERSAEPASIPPFICENNRASHQNVCVVTFSKLFLFIKLTGKTEVGIMTLIRGDPQGNIPENKSPAPDEKKKREKEKVTIFFCRLITCVQLWCLSDITSDPADSTGRILLQGSRHILNALSQRLSRSCLVPPIRRYYVSLTTRTPCAGPLNWLVIYLSQALR